MKYIYYSHILIFMTQIDHSNHNPDNCQIGSTGGHNLWQVTIQPMTCQNLTTFAAGDMIGCCEGGRCTRCGQSYNSTFYNIICIKNHFGATKTLYTRGISSPT